MIIIIIIIIDIYNENCTIFAVVLCCYSLDYYPAGFAVSPGLACSNSFFTIFLIFMSQSCRRQLGGTIKPKKKPGVSARLLHSLSLSLSIYLSFFLFLSLFLPPSIYLSIY